MPQIKNPKPYSGLSSLLGLSSFSSGRSLEKSSSTPQPITITKDSLTTSPPSCLNPSTPDCTLSSSASAKVTLTSTCLLFPSYAIRSSNDSDSDWTVRVKGRAFSKAKPTRANKFALGMACKIANVNKTAAEYSSLEQRLGMFFDNNHTNRSLNVEVVGLTTPGSMVLDGANTFAEEPEELDLGEAFPFQAETSSRLNVNQPKLSGSVSTVDSASLSTPPESLCNSRKGSHNSIDSVASQVDVKDGHFHSTITLSNQTVNTWARSNSLLGQPKKSLVIQAYDSPTDAPAFGQIQLIEPTGVSIISDIDDTIKDSGVFRGKKHVLKATFLHECREVPGMSEVYQEWADHGASFHYVSNSPWQLFPMLEKFFEKFSFPIGSAHLKLWDLNHKALFYEPLGAKRASILQLLKDFPNRKFVCVGDSGEMDLELYTSLARDHPDQIVKIFIRDVSTINLPETVSSKKSPFSYSRFLSSPRAPKSESSSNVSISSSPSSFKSSWSGLLSRSKPNSTCSSSTKENFDIYGTCPASSFKSSTSSVLLPDDASNLAGSWDDGSSLMSSNPALQAARGKLQRRIATASQGLSPNLVTIFSSPTSLLECPIVKTHIQST